MADFKRLGDLFLRTYGEEAAYGFESFGRLELLGNHTDHQGGCSIVATSTLSIQACVSEGEDVEILSEGYPPFRFPLSDIAPKESEKGTSIALTKGILSYFKGHGRRIGGFKAVLRSDIFEGAGISSSAAYETLIGKILSVLYNGDALEPTFLAKAGQYAENAYFGKPCGLLDQMGSVLGGASFLDFKDPKEPKFQRIEPNFKGFSTYLLNPGLSHTHLSYLYASIPSDMGAAAYKVDGKKRLIDVPYPLFLERMEGSSLTDNERTRALHFYQENERVKRAFRYLLEGEISAFFECERETELSQETLLRNVMVEGAYPGSPLEAANRANAILKEGFARVMGGGFAGTVLCFVGKREEAAFEEAMGKLYGERNVVKTGINMGGPYGLKL